MEKFGGIELDTLLGGYEIVNQPADTLPQDLASAIGSINGSLLGATFEPIWYVAKQLVNGTNHYLVCREIRSTKDKAAGIVGLVIHIPIGCTDGEGASIVEIIEEAKLPDDVQMAFDTAEKQLMGVGYKPVAYIGRQVVRGLNHIIVCQAKGLYPGARPYAVMMVLNVFEGAASIVSITPIEKEEKPKLFGCPLGEWP